MAGLEDWLVWVGRGVSEMTGSQIPKPRLVGQS